MTLTHGSLFTGIGGFDLGFEWAGIKTRWQVEKDKYCLQLLRERWPDVMKHEDIATFSGGEQVDIISGGFPCQDISSAGKGVGLTGERSGLWFEMLRVITELRPRWAVIENVPVLRVRGSDTVLDGLEKQGYTCWPFVVGAWAIGARHKRDRVWIMAHAYSVRGSEPTRLSGQQRKGLSDIDGSSGCRTSEGRKDVAHTERVWRRESANIVAETQGPLDSPERAESTFQFGPGSEGLCNSAIQRLPDWAGGEVGQPSPLTEFEPGGREIELSFRGMAHGVSRRVDRLRALGNAVVPQIPYIIARAILQAETRLQA